jgi:hypothetical protein
MLREEFVQVSQEKWIKLQGARHVLGFDTVSCRRSPVFQRSVSNYLQCMSTSQVSISSYGHEYYLGVGS